MGARSGGRRWTIAGLTVVLLAAGGCGSGNPERTSPTSPAPPAASTSAAVRFLDRYVTEDGRVLRHDQGDDVVSEGQAYGMLVAELAGRPQRARSIWAWSKAHLLRPNGLLAFHADSAGRVLDPHAATDADTLAAYALLRYRGDGAAGLRSDGRRLASSVLAYETVPGRGGPTLVAGTWATGQPPTVNPSYWMPGVFHALATYTGDPRWAGSATAAVSMLDQVTEGGQTLPPDWAKLTDGDLEPIPAPDGSSGVRYGLDAARVPIWLASGCTAAAHQLAASWWTHVLSGSDRPSHLALSLTGDPMDAGPHPVPLVAAAAAARAAGDAASSRALLGQAERQAAATPTYYGDAWVALGPALLDRALDPCRDR